MALRGIIKNQPIKFDVLTIFISLDPHRDVCFKPRSGDKDKPYIRIKIASVDFATKYFRDIYKASFGTVSESDGIITLNIVGYRNVFRALVIMESWGVAEQKKFAPFHQLKKICADYLAEKATQPRHLPRKAVQFDQTKCVDQFDADGDGIIRSFVQKKKAQVNNKKPSLYLYKPNEGERSQTDIEVFESFCYRLLLNDRHPKTRGLYKEGQRLGLLVKMYDNFQSYYQIYQSESEQGNLQSFSAEALVESEIIKIIAAAFIEKENDLHTGNFGKNGSVYAVKIDSGRSEWPAVAPYFDIDSNLPFPESLNSDIVNGVTVPPISIPAQSFKITAGDVRGLPYLETTKVARWPVLTDNIFEQFEEARMHQKFHDDKYSIFLKRALIPDSVYQAIGLAAIQSDKKRAQLVKRKCMRTKEVKAVLQQIDEFYDYLETPELLEQILADFKKYNDDFKKPEDEYLKLDLKEIEKNFHELKSSRPSFFARNIYLRNLFISFGAAVVGVAAAIGMTAFLGGVAPWLGITVASLLVAGSIGLTMVTGALILFLVPLAVMIATLLIEKHFSAPLCAEADESDSTLRNDIPIELMEVTTARANSSLSEPRIPRSASVNAFSVFAQPFSNCMPLGAPCEVTPLLQHLGLK